MRVDGVEVDMETAVTKENIVDMYGVVIDGYFYNFTESGQHTIEYILNDMTVNGGLCVTIGDFEYFGISFPSKITNASVEIDGNTIEALSFGYSPAIESVTIGNSVTSIGEGAFWGCTGLTSATIGNSVTSIDAQAFEGCSGLTSATIGSSVASIEIYGFSKCTSLTSITSLATTAPTIQSSTFQNVKTNGTLTVPSGSNGYDVWMGTGDYYLGKYNWTKVEQ